MIFYKGLQGKLYEYLKIEPRARERHFKDRACVNLLLEKYPTLKEIPKEMLIAFVQDYNSLDRYWRLLTAAFPELRGSDYDTKEKVETRKELSLGYYPNFQADIKKLATIR